MFSATNKRGVGFGSLFVLATLAGVFLLARPARAVLLTANTGPGGFTELGAASDLSLWLKGDAGITKDASDYVSLWADQSGRANDVTQAVALQQPLSNTAQNNVPLVTFDGGAAPVGERDEMLSTSSVSARTIFIANVTHSQNTSANPVIGNSTNYISIRCLAGEGWRVPGDGNDFTNPTGSTFRVDGADGSDSVLGTPQVLNAVREPAAYNFAQLKLGQHTGYSERAWNGSMGELVVFNRKLNEAETIVVDNHLRAKFDVDLNTAGAQDVYAGDQAANGDYDRDVVGVGRVDAANQVTAAGAAGLGIETAGTTANGAFVAAGHKTATNNSLTAADMPAGVQRWDRVWYVDKTASTDAALTFDHGDGGLATPGAGTQLALMRSATNAFGFAQVEATPQINGDRVAFDVPNTKLEDGYYTVAQIAPTTGPGGFTTLGPSSDLTLWLKGDAGITQDGAGGVSNWADQSGHEADLSQATSGNQPTQTNTLNGVPLVTFDGDGAGDPDFLSFTQDVSAQTIFFVSSTLGPGTGGASADAILGGGPTWTKPAIRRHSSGTTKYQGITDTDLYDFTDPGSYPGSEFRINNAATDVAGLNEQHIVYALHGSSAVGLTASKNFNIGTHTNGTEYRAWNGEMGEFIVFNRQLNTAERLVVDNYISAKYGVDLAAGDMYAGDEATNGDYDLDMIGVGRVDASNILTGAHAMGLGIDATGDLDDGEFVMAGHKTSGNGWTSDDLTGSINNRWERVWYIDQPDAGDVDVQLTFDFSEGGLLNPPQADTPYSLLYSPTNAFDFSILSLAPTWSGDQLMFALSGEMLQDGYYTLGIVPEPATGLLLIVGLLGLTLRGRRRRR